MNPFTILAVLPWYPANAPVFLAQSFEHIGCRVIRVGPLYSNHMNLKWPEEDLPKVDILLHKEIDWNIDGFIDQATKMGFPPDLVFVSEENYHNVIINTKKIPSILYSCDGWPENYNRADMVKATVNMTNHPLGIDAYPREEIDPRWQYLPGAAAPWVHCDLKLERYWDFCMLASFYGNRKTLSDELTKNGIKVWSGQATTKTFVEGYNRSIATFHNARRGEVKWKFFETTAMGCINISGWSKLFPQLGYKPWVHYVPIETPLGNEWPTVDALSNLVKCFKGDYKEGGVGIANNARKHTLRNHTYLHRIRQIFSALGYSDNIRLIEKTNDAIGAMIKEAWLVPG